MDQGLRIQVEPGCDPLSDRIRKAEKTDASGGQHCETRSNYPKDLQGSGWLDCRARAVPQREVEHSDNRDTE
jgi:hypothetical protein